MIFSNDLGASRKAKLFKNSFIKKYNFLKQHTKWIEESFFKSGSLFNWSHVVLNLLQGSANILDFQSFNKIRRLKILFFQS
jgi:hypothetical protein